MKSISEINKAIATIQGFDKNDDFIQETGIAVLEHLAANNDNAVVCRFYLALPKGYRKTAMASWLLAYGALKANTDPENKKAKPFVYDKTKETRPEAAAVDMWYNHKPDAAPDQVFDLQKAIRKVLAKAAKGATTATPEQLKALAKVVDIPESDVPSLVKKAKPSKTESAALGAMADALLDTVGEAAL